MTFEDLGRVLPEVDAPEAVGLRVPEAVATWRFRKTPIYLTAGTDEVTLRTSGEEPAALAWVPAHV